VNRELAAHVLLYLARRVEGRAVDDDSRAARIDRWVFTICERHIQRLAERMPAFVGPRPRAIHVASWERPEES
jgi:hypothetical protein